MAEPGGNHIASAVEETASEHLGVESWDRPAIYRECAAAATDNGLPYWTVLVLSGAIATLGLALNSSAVVIGAMLVAPLLAPIVGLALALALGDGRLAAQTGAVVLGSIIAVILIAALLTALLPFHTITLEVAARTRPTTLDLAIAVFSGLAGAVVTVHRGSRLSAAIPGVAISVALIPPLAVAGFGIGVGWDGELIRGSLLLFSANLAGIVLSGMALFLLVGMHRENVRATARRWHRETETRGLAAWACRVRGLRSLGVFRSSRGRVGLVLGFAVVLGIPLNETLAEIARERRIERAIQVAAELFQVPGRASILDREMVLASQHTQVYLRVATTAWFDAQEREEFERTASALAKEPVQLSLEQLPVRGEDIEQLAALLPGERSRREAPRPPPAPPGLADLLASANIHLRQTMDALTLPENVAVVQVELATTQEGNATLRVVYAAPDTLATQAEQMLRRQLMQVLALPDLRMGLQHISTAPHSLGEAVLDTVRLREVADILHSYEALAAEILVPEDMDIARAQPATEWLTSRGIEVDRIIVREEGRSELRVRIHPRRTEEES